MTFRAALRVLMQPLNLVLTVLGVAMMVWPFVTDGFRTVYGPWVAVGGFTLVGIMGVVITLSLYEGVRNAHGTEAPPRRDAR